MKNYYYLNVQFAVESGEKTAIDIYKLQQIIAHCVKSLFGEAGAGNQVDILKYEEKKEGKDVIIFATAEDHQEPSKVTLPEPEPQPGLILPNGEINWNCPCLGGMATGPCGVEFREAFSCFHNSKAEPKGSDCFDAFKEMHLCMAEYPQLYSRYDEDEDEDLLNLENENKEFVSENKKNENEEKSTSKPNVDDSPKVEKKASVQTDTTTSVSSIAEGNLKLKVESVNA